jgi:hypothetical protein
MWWRWWASREHVCPQQAASDLNKTRDAYDAQLQKGKEMGLDEAVQEEPVCRSEKDKHDRRCMQRFQNVWTQSAFQSLSFQAACETSVHDVLATQPFRDSSPPPHRLPEGDPTLKLHAQVPRVESTLKLHAQVPRPTPNLHPQVPRVE